jgi:hypothetical protein
MGRESTFLSIELKIDILGKVSNFLPRSSDSVTTRDLDELQLLYGPTLFPLIVTDEDLTTTSSSPRELR